MSGQNPHRGLSVCTSVYTDHCLSLGSEGLHAEPVLSITIADAAFAFKLSGLSFPNTLRNRVSSAWSGLVT